MIRLGFIVIGRNEGARLEACLASIPPDSGPIVYVDSGSSDDSVAAAQKAGALIVELNPVRPFTAARARNEGAAAFAMAGHAPDYLQFIDGDCTLASGWVETAVCFLNTTPDAAVVCGRRRERHPETSVYNRLCDREWDTPIGQARACGGDALMRREAFESVSGFRESLIAGEEPELCVRLRAKGWTVWRLDAEMTLHDAAMTHFSEWWRRARRGGFAEIACMVLHGRGPDRRGVVRTIRAIFWALVVPFAAIGGAVTTSWSLMLLLAYPAQIIRLAWRNGGKRIDWEEALFSVLGQFAAFLGILEYLRRITILDDGSIISYK